MAPLIRAFLDSEAEFDLQVCVTGQHRQMLDQVLNLFKIKPNFDLNLMTSGQSLSDINAAILIKISTIILEEKPDLILVHGDTSTSMSTALASFFSGVPVGHVEAGLRTYDVRAPYPEEFNRQVISKVASYHFAPTDQCKDNLLNERVDPDSIWVTGNTVIDALEYTLQLIHDDIKIRNQLYSDLFEKLHFDIMSSKYILITGHRRENFGEGFVNICSSIKDMADKFPDLHFVYPVHLNPNVHEPVHRMLGENRNIHLIEPQDYLHFLLLLENCYLVLTDSGGIQEEAPSLGKPVLVMRDKTERPEVLTSGAVKLVGTDKSKILTEVTKLIEDENYYCTMSEAKNPYGDGTAAAQIVGILKQNLVSPLEI
jgi:UDP-N-acetylglucosamine 2-epimerase (non-hydrolysing)